MKVDEFDSIIFDCDGVLIDVTKSYDTTINKTISYALKEMDPTAYNVMFADWASENQVEGYF